MDEWYVDADDRAGAEALQVAEEYEIGAAGVEGNMY
jgi:hypothetical protein